MSTQIHIDSSTPTRQDISDDAIATSNATAQR
jgi:hypothetical protein